MKKVLFLLVVLFALCLSVFAVTYAEGETLDVYPDTVISGARFCIQFEPKNESATVSSYGSAKTLMTMGDKTGTSNLTISNGGSVDYAQMVELFESNTEIFIVLAADKTFVAKATFSSIDGLDFSARLSKVGSAEYIVGGAGPAGGIVFYDKGEYSDGWRYLEAAPSDLRVVAGNPSVDKSDPWYDFGDELIIFGYYKSSPNDRNLLFVNGLYYYDWRNCTDTKVGAGKMNTELLVKAMGSYAYSSYEGTETTANYAAKLCDDLVYNRFDDWFLPSLEELYLMYDNLHRKGIGGFANNNYWSSSEYHNYAFGALYQDFANGGQSGFDVPDRVHDRYYDLYVRPVRAF